MSDNSDSEQPTKSNLDDSVTVFGSEIDDDWGEAFEADDFMLAPDEDTSSEFFLDDDELESDTAPSSAAEQTSHTTSDIPPPPDTASSPALIAGQFTPVKNFITTSKDRILALPIIYRVPLLAVPLLFVVLFSYLFTSSPDVPSPETTTTDETTSLSPVPVEQDEHIVKEVVESAEKPAEKIRNKWALPPFLISISDDMKGDDVFFVEVDITLILLAETEEVVSGGVSVMVRDMIYQFFNNRPLYELRRFSLARGEMNRKLLSWLEKQWPEGQIAAIVFNSYRVM